MTLISVIIPARNRPGMLKEAVESVVAQTYRPIEIIVILTGATKETRLAALGLSASYAIRVIETVVPLNLAATRNAGLNIAKGAWVSFLDDDDIWLPEKLSAQMHLAQETDAAVVTTNWVRFGEAMADEIWMPEGKSPLPDGMNYREALILNNYVSVGSLVRTDVLRKLGGFDARLRACEDWDMWRRVSANHNIVYLDRILMKVRIHGQNMSGNRLLMNRAWIRHLIKMSFDIPADLRPVFRASVLRFLQHTALTAVYSVFSPETRTWRALRAIKRWPVQISGRLSSQPTEPRKP